MRHWTRQAPSRTDPLSPFFLPPFDAAVRSTSRSSLLVFLLEVGQTSAAWRSGKLQAV
jgi:hypothetical protein